ncbi:MAG TPA: HigA family addiction module antitoxin [Armatimonadota bacterium]|jgi:addiction module HigA family antidote
MVPAANESIPDYAVAPGETLAETLAELGLSQQDLATRTGHTPKMLSQIINGKAPITSDTAVQFERVLGVPAAFWLNLEREYREALTRQRDVRDAEQADAMLARFPVREMISRGLVARAETKASQLMTLLSFFRVGSVAQLRPDVAGAMFRKTNARRSDEYALWTWLMEGEWKAREIPCAKYDPKTFRDALAALRPLTRAPLREAEPQITAACARAGVALAFVPEYPQTRVLGAARWLTPKRPTILLSYRLKREDSIWFSLFHEAGHILLRHPKTEVFISEEGGLSDEREEQANEFARNALIPPAEWARFVASAAISARDVQRQADAWDIDPGIIAGRLKKEGRIPYSHHAALHRSITA